MFRWLFFRDIGNAADRRTVKLRSRRKRREREHISGVIIRQSHLLREQEKIELDTILTKTAIK